MVIWMTIKNIKQALNFFENDKKNQASRRMGDPRHMAMHTMPGVQQAHQQATLQVVNIILFIVIITIISINHSVNKFDEVN